MKSNIVLSGILVSSLLFTACKKDTTNTATDDTLPSQVLADFTNHIALANLSDLSLKAGQFDAAVQAFVNAPSASGLTTLQQQWYHTRTAWEQSEAFLFGPVASLELDPAIDSWPVNFVDIDSVVTGTAVFTSSFIDSLNPTLKGFHPIEYLIFGKKKTRTYTGLSARQLQFLSALSMHLHRVTARMYNEWAINGGNFAGQVTKAGTPASQYSSRRDAMFEIVNAMTGIVEEVGEGKIEEPFSKQDATLEESPFAMNSWNDFRNNLIGVRNVYTCRYVTQGKSMSDFVSQHNKALDLKIRQKLDAAINNLAAYNIPFGDAIVSAPASVLSTQNVLNDLKTILESELAPLVQQQVN